MRPSLQQILDHVASKRGLEVEAIMKTGRTSREADTARGLFFVLAWRTGHSNASTARYVGRNPSTATKSRMHVVREISAGRVADLNAPKGKVSQAMWERFITMRHVECGVDYAPPVLHDIMAYVCRRYGYTEAAIRGSGRTKTLALARHVFCWMAREYSHASYPMIARYVGRLDHTTVIHGRNKIDLMIAAGEIERPGLPGPEPTISVEVSWTFDDRPPAAWQRSYCPFVRVFHEILPWIKHQQIRRRYRVVPPAGRPAPLPANVTALLMGDPPIERSALALEAAE